MSAIVKLGTDTIAFRDLELCLHVIPQNQIRLHLNPNGNGVDSPSFKVSWGNAATYITGVCFEKIWTLIVSPELPSQYKKIVDKS
jgi:hypothetical protein